MLNLRILALFVCLIEVRSFVSGNGRLFQPLTMIGEPQPPVASSRRVALKVSTAVLLGAAAGALAVEDVPGTVSVTPSRVRSDVDYSKIRVPLNRENVELGKVAPHNDLHSLFQHLIQRFV
jgi:hypothetical protein